MKGVRRAVRCAADVRVAYALVGVFCSIVAHELLHVLLHVDDIQSIHVFPDWTTIVSIDVATMFDAVNEEMYAYGLTVAILLLTAIDVIAIHDSRDARSVRDILSSRNDVFNSVDDAVVARILANS